MLDRSTVILYGWKLTDEDQINSVYDDFCDDYEDFIENHIVIDSMCGNYCYIGEINKYFDNDEEWEFSLEDDLSSEAASKLYDYLSKNIELTKIVNHYVKGQPQLYIFNHIS